jgi:hypothetical protein
MSSQRNEAAFAGGLFVEVDRALAEAGREASS